MLRCPSNECRQRRDGFKLSNSKMLLGNDGNFYFYRKKGPLSKETVISNLNRKMTCLACGYSGKTKEFVDAYNNPMKHFDTDNLCDCGGEIWNDFEVVKNNTMPEIEFEAGDSQRKVAVTVKNSYKCERCGKIFDKEKD